jgi:orotate phosphoribosyltransferase
MLSQSLKDCGAFLTGEFVLTSGKKSNFYIDIKQASTNPLVLKEIAERMAEHTKEKKIAGMELGAVPIAVALSLETGIPYVIIRKGERKHGTGKAIEGKLDSGEKVLIVEDVATSGGSIVKAANILREAGAVVDRALVVVDREEGAKELLTKQGIELVPMVTISELL